MPEDPNDANRGASPKEASHGRLSLGRRRLLRGVGFGAPVVLTLHSRPVLAQTCATASASASLNPSGIARAQRSGIACEGLSPAEWLASHDGWESSQQSLQGTTGDLTTGDAATFGSTSVADGGGTKTKKNGTNGGGGGSGGKNGVAKDGIGELTTVTTNTETTPVVLAGHPWPETVSPYEQFAGPFNPPLGAGGQTMIDVLRINEPNDEETLAQACVATLLNVAAKRVEERFFGSFGDILNVWHDAHSGSGFVPNAGAQPWGHLMVAQWLATSWGDEWPGWADWPES